MEYTQADYQKALKQAEELMDRAYGKAKESLELTGVKKLLVDF